MNFLLGTLPGTDRDRIERLLLPNSEDYTVIDFAGMHKAFECLLIMIVYFRENFHILQLIFSYDKQGKMIPNNESITNKDLNDEKLLDNNPPWTITRVSKKNLSSYQ
jgi:hypothetical protein